MFLFNSSPTKVKTGPRRLLLNGLSVSVYSVPTVALDKLIHQGLASGGDYGIIEGKHFCRLDPNERNSSKFLYDPLRNLKLRLGEL
jgi:hypothetical protein